VYVLESLPQYSAIVKHALDALRGIGIIGTASFISCNTLYEKLCTADCEECGDFGGYLYILTCRRLCYKCFTEQEKYQPLLYSNAIRKFGINMKILDSLPRMRSLSGKYSPRGKECKEQIALVDFESAYRAGVVHRECLDDMEKMENHGMTLSTSRSERFPPPPPSPPQDPFDGKPGNPARFMAIVRTPWFNRALQQAEIGFHCVACEKSYRGGLLYWRRKFTLISFAKHLEECGIIRDRKHQ
jgi:hypothetical protein